MKNFPVALISFFLIFSSLAMADEVVQAPHPEMDWNDLQLGGTAAIQQARTRLGVTGRYLPEYVFDRDAGDHFWSVGVDLGLTIFSRTDEPSFLVYEYGGYVAYHLNPNWDFRLVAGAQTWSNRFGTSAFVGPDVIYHFSSEQKYFNIDGLFLSYKPVFQSDIANWVSAGINFKF